MVCRYCSILIAAVGLAAAGPLALAEQAPVPPAPGAQVEAPPAGQTDAEQQKRQVRNFGAVLKSAIESAAQRLQGRVLQEVPNAPPLSMAGETDVLGLPHPDGGFVFTVQVPDIEAGYFVILEMQRRRQQVPSPARPVTTEPPPDAVVIPAPIKPSSTFDPVRELSDFVRENLIEAMVENSQALGVIEGAQLVVVASVSAEARRNPLEMSRLLVLSIKGEDLAAFRQGRLTKAEVKLRIVDRRF
jgi:hypothetical protein